MALSNRDTVSDSSYSVEDSATCSSASPGFKTTPWTKWQLTMASTNEFTVESSAATKQKLELWAASSRSEKDTMVAICSS